MLAPGHHPSWLSCGRIDQRRELVAELSASGVPVLDQAALLGVSDWTVHNDKRTNKAEVPHPSEDNGAGDDQDQGEAPHPPAPTPAQRKAAEAAERQRIQDEAGSVGGLG